MKLNIPRVENMLHPSGANAPNQFIITTKQGIVFQSYASVIAYMRHKDGQIFLDVNDWDYSVTTGRFRNRFLDENIAETRRKIETGQYKLVDLNP